MWIFTHSLHIWKVMKKFGLLRYPYHYNFDYIHFLIYNVGTALSTHEGIVVHRAHFCNHFTLKSITYIVQSQFMMHAFFYMPSHKLWNNNIIFAVSVDICFVYNTDCFWKVKWGHVCYVLYVVSHSLIFIYNTYR